MKTLLITGATGFTGHFIVDEAIAQNYKVIAAIRKNNKLYSFILHSFVNYQNKRC